MGKIRRVRERCEFSPIEKHIGALRTGKLLHRFVKNNLVLIGDTALQANPLVGEGIRFVMDSSRIASKWIKKSIEKNNLNLLKNYEKEWKRKYYSKFKICRFAPEFFGTSCLALTILGSANRRICGFACGYAQISQGETSHILRTLYSIPPPRFNLF